MKIAFSIARYLLAVVFLVFGLNGFLHFIALPTMTGVAAQYMGALYVSNYLALIFGLQIVAAVLLLLNRFVPLGLVVLAPLLVNIVCFHAFMAPAGLPLPLFLSILWCTVAYRHRAAFAGLFQMREPAVTNEPVGP